MQQMVPQCCSVTNRLLCYTAVFILFLSTSPASSLECKIIARVCTAEEGGGIWIESASNGRSSVMTFTCRASNLRPAFKYAYVFPDCKSFGAPWEMPASDMNGMLNYYFQTTPQGAYYVLVSQTFIDGSTPVAPFISLFNDEGEFFKTRGVLAAMGFEDKYYANHAPAVESLDIEQRTAYTDFDSCRDSTFGEEYTGAISTTISGIPCQPWNTQAPNSHNYTDLPDAKCRNPNRDRNGPWCFLSNRLGFEQCNISYCDRSEEGFILIGKKGNFLPTDIKKHIVIKGSQEVEVTHTFETDYMGRPPREIEPLSPADIPLFNPRVYNVFDNLEGYQYTKDRGKALVTWSEIVSQENAKVYGWEFIPANPGSPLFFFLKAAGPDSGKLNFFAKFKPTITEDMISANPEEQEIIYTCLPEPVSVESGDFYGYFRLETGLNHLKAIYPFRRSSEPYPCGRQFSYADADTFRSYPNLYDDVYMADTEDIRAMDPPPSNVKIALKPILDSDFVYTCGCGSDTDCQAHADENMICSEQKCKCKQGYEYYRKANKCIHATMEHKKDVYQSSTFKYQNASYAVDGNKSPSPVLGTFSKTLLEWNPWWVVDMGTYTNVYAVKITPTAAIESHIVLGEQEKPATYVFIREAYESIDQEPLSQTELRNFTVYGPVPWQGIQAGSDPNVQVLNPTLQEKLRYTSDNNLEFTNIQSLHKISLYNLRSEDGSHDFYVNNNIFEVYNVNSRHSAPPIHWCCYTPGRGYLWMDPSANAFLSSVSGSTPSFHRSEKGYLKLYESSAAMQSGNDLRVEAVVAEEMLVLVTIGDLCLSCTSEGCAFNEECNTRLQFVEYLSSELNWASYTELTYTYQSGSNNMLVHFNNTTEFEDNPLCYKILGAEDATSQTAIVSIMGKNKDRTLQVKISRSQTSSSIRNENKVWISVSNPAFNRGKIGLTQKFYGREFKLDEFKWCVPHVPMLEPGKETYIDCDKPTHGRFLGLYSDSKHSLELSNVQVLSFPGCLPGQVHPGCNMDITCDNTFHECEHECLEDTNSPGVLSCLCHEGYLLRDDGKTCENLDKCADTNCQQNCDSTDGKCSCSDGYELNDDQTTCSVITTPQIETTAVTTLPVTTTGSVEETTIDSLAVASGQKQEEQSGEEGSAFPMWAIPLIICVVAGGAFFVLFAKGQKNDEEKDEKENTDVGNPVGGNPAGGNPVAEKEGDAEQAMSEGEEESAGEEED